MKRLIVAALALAMGVWAQGPRGGGFGPGGPGGGMGMMAQGGVAGSPDALKEYLALTDSQVTQLKELRTKRFEAAKPIMEQIRTKSQELRTLLDSANPDPAKVGQLTVEIKNLREQLKNLRTSDQDSALAILTPEQRTKLKALEDALKLMPAAHQAVGLGLLEAPQPPAGKGLFGRALKQRGLRARATTRV
jgi:Spy/CpxP family protein refolding chaperone